jgi:Uma2 family endonuclease
MPLPAPGKSGHWTVRDLYRLPDDGNRYEIIDGRLYVSPAPSRRHQRAVALLLSELLAYLGPRNHLEALPAPTDVQFADDSVVQPDILVAPAPGHNATSDIIDRLALAIEVLSPATAHVDRQDKLRLYQREAIPEYWILDLDARSIERWHADASAPEILSRQLTWTPEGMPAPFVLDLADFFAKIWRD